MGRARVFATCGLYLLVAAGVTPGLCRADTSRTELRERAVSLLRKAVHQGRGFEKVHAAEALVWNGYFRGIREVFEGEEKEAGPPYRIGVWRVLARVQGNDAVARRHYMEKIRAVFLDAGAPDRVHALEALAKLGHFERSEEVLSVAEEETGSFQAFARWVLANSGSIADEASLAELLDSPAARVNAAYALRHLSRVQPATLGRLEAAYGEAADPRSRVYLLSAWYVHAPTTLQPRLKDELVRFLAGADREQQVEICAALGTAGDLADEPLLAELLDDPQVRVGAANALLRIERRQHRGLTSLDWGVMLGYGLIVVAFGWFLSRRQSTTEDFFVGGRTMKPFSIGISLFATLLSTVSYLAHPGEMIKHGPVILASMVMIPVVYFVVGYGLIPYLMRLPVTSAYQILEGPLGTRIRLFGSVVFILTRLVWMGLMIYLAGRIMIVVLDWPPETLPYLLIVAGLVTVLYTALGGLRAVVFTDVVQFFILLGGAILTVLLIHYELGSVRAWFPTSWAPNWDVQPFFSSDPRVRATVVGTLLNSAIFWICTAGADQLAIQRYLATRDATAARRAFLINSIAGIFVTVALALVGFALLGFFSANPQLIPDGKSLIDDADYLFPHYIASFLPVGLAGLVIVAMFAAVMSSLDSGINSISTVIMVDFVDRKRKRRGSEGRHLSLARYLTFGIGVAVVLLSSIMDKIPGNLQEVAAKTMYLFLVPMFILFFLALFVPFATAFGAAFSSLYSFAAGALIAFWDVLTGQPGLSFQWIAVVAMVVGMISGPLLSLIPLRGKGPRVVAFWSLVASLPLIAVFWMVLR